MIALVTKKNIKESTTLAKEFAVSADAKDIVKFINKISDLSDGAVNKVDEKEIKEQISVAGVIVRNLSNNEIVGYMGSKIVGKTRYHLPIIELRSGAISKEYGGNGINGDNRAILLDTIREKYPNAIIVSIKNSANGGWSAKSLQSMGFLYPKNPNTLEEYKKDIYMRGIGIPEKFFEQKKNGTPDRTVWIGIQTKESYDKFYGYAALDINDSKLLSLAQGMLRKEFDMGSSVINKEEPISNMLRMGVTL